MTRPATRWDHPPAVRMRKVPGTRAPWWFAAAALALAAADASLDPTRTHVPLCPLHSMTGLSCPFCGGLRAVAELVRGHFTTAVRDNALLIAALPVVVVLWSGWVARVRRGAEPRRWSPTLRFGVVVVVVGFAVVRNLPFATALRP